ncbi:uncharacterized protein LY89DRAFT_196787 [Mollisia scopiformis]|uniref:Uncharacterized protein n=1 Tax=Mollisia scopiformis TaxID=149040 RepID=A0A194WZ86_MOLSC|nr:uncharacterized protein LY89DRAFT_196787 [Mollisia scopiformis]KUJ12907.1 hypothetical protein LY89DRAFT_196787 [Mollisia scopiformis]
MYALTLRCHVSSFHFLSLSSILYLRTYALAQVCTVCRVVFLERRVLYCRIRIASNARPRERTVPPEYVSHHQAAEPTQRLNSITITSPHT